MTIPFQIVLILSVTAAGIALGIAARVLKERGNKT